MLMNLRHTLAAAISRQLATTGRPSRRSRRRTLRTGTPVAGEYLEVRSLLTATTAELVAALPVFHQETASNATVDENGTASSGEESSGLQPLSSIPALHSNPDATATLFLDFDGNFESSWLQYRDVNSPAFTLDTDLTRFNAWELATIQEVWARVAEDFAPFDLDVTTEDPGSFEDGEALHVVIGGSPYDWLGSAAGGVGTDGGFFNDEPNVVFVFTDYQWPGRERAVGIANTVSHEAGHGFGLDHQQEFDANGNVINCYRRGDAHAGPIMGSTEVSERSVWVLGPGESPTDIVDEMAIIAGPQNGFEYRPDDHGDTMESASLLDGTDQHWTGSGIITQISDIDVFRFHSEGGTAVFNVSPSVLGPNLIVAAELRSSSGEVLVSQVGSDTGSSSLVVDLPTGDYFLTVHSNGEYGSVGQYTIAGSVTDPHSQIPGTPAGLETTSEYGFRHLLSWDAVTDAAGYHIYRRGIAGAADTLVESLPVGTTSTAIVIPRFPYAAAQSWFCQYRVEAFNSAGVATSGWQTVQHQFSTPTNVRGLNVQVLSPTSVQLTWQTDARSEVQRLTVMQYTAPRTFFYERFLWLNPDQASVTLNDLIPGQEYAFAISGVTPAGRAGASVDFTMPSDAAPSTPASLTVSTNSPTSVNLNWNDSDTEDGYQIFQISGSNRVLVGTAAANTTQFTVNSLTPRTEYRFVVEAFNASGTAESTSPAVTPVTVDEHGDTLLTATQLTAPASVTSAIDQAGDRDTFSFQAEAGATYVIATSLDSGPQSLRDSVLELLDAHGRLLAINDDFGGSLASRLIWTTPENLQGQSVFIVVRGYARSQVGDYGLSIGVTRPVPDDYGNTISSASRLSAPSSVAGGIQSRGDFDVFAVQVSGGATYVFSTTLQGQADDLRDSVIELLDSHGRRLGFNDDSGGTLASRLTWTAPTTMDGQTIYLAVRAYTYYQTGEYGLTVSVTPPSADDYGNTIATSARVATPTAAAPTELSASIERSGDVDTFAVQVHGGTTYVFSTTLQQQTGALRDSVIDLFECQGRRLGFNDDFGGTLASRLTWTAPTAMDGQTVYLAVRAYSQYQTGSYGAMISALVPAPSVNTTTTSSTALSVGSRTLGNIGTQGAVDRFQLEVSAGQRIEILTQLLTLRDSTITVYNSRGQRIAFNDDYTGSLASRVSLLATERDTWTIEVRAYSSFQTGTYRLLVNTF